jgi:hypothetical protein
MILAAECLLSIINGPFSPSNIEVDIVVDAALILWNKTKTVFQKHQTGSSDNPFMMESKHSAARIISSLTFIDRADCGGSD